MSTDYTLPEPVVSQAGGPVLVVDSMGFPAPTHPVEADLFCRQAAMPGHSQHRIESAHLAIIGCGGLGGWIAIAAARMGFRQLTLIDHDRFDRSNSPRQVMFGADIGQSKAHALARNVVAHMTNKGTITAVAEPFPKAMDYVVTEPTVMVVGVDNNPARVAATSWGLHHNVPVVFVMLSLDGLRTQVFLQEPDGPCLSCVLPNLEFDSHAQCASAAVMSCLLAASYATKAVAAVVMGNRDTPRWREASLDGSAERFGNPSPRPGCRSCGNL